MKYFGQAISRLLRAAPGATAAAPVKLRQGVGIDRDGSLRQTDTRGGVPRRV